jgi:hypothetical protein
MGRQIAKGSQPIVVLGLPTQEVNSSITLSSNKMYLVDTTSAALTLTLPANPSIGDVVEIIDAKGQFATNNLTVNPGTLAKIMRQPAADTMVVSVAGAAFSLVYYDSTNGWLLEGV